MFDLSMLVAVSEVTMVADALMTPSCTSASVHAVSFEVHRNEYATQTLPGLAATDCVWPTTPLRQFNADTSLMQKPANAKRSTATEHLGVTGMRSVRWIRRLLPQCLKVNKLEKDNHRSTTCSCSSMPSSDP